MKPSVPVVRRLLIALLALAALVALAPAAYASGFRATKRALARAWHGAGHAGAYVVDLQTGRVLLSSLAGRPRIPASVNKLFTTSTALTLYGAGATLRTDVLAGAEPDANGVVHANLYLRGGGDPSFGHVQAKRLARQLARDGLTAVNGRVVGDESAWDTLRGGPESNYQTSDWAGPLSALAYDEGMTGRRSPSVQRRPARFAARGFTRALRRAGIPVRHAGRSGVTQADAVPILSWVSPDMGTLVARTDIPSDNYMAEELLKGIGARFGVEGSTAAGATVVRATVERFGARPTIVDGSGLSRRDRTSPRDVVSVLKAMDGSDEAIAFENALPVAGRTGTLSERMRTTAASGRCRAKTGTLSDVSALAGICDTTHGRRVAFAFLMNRTSVYWAHVRQDKLTSILARYAG